MEIAHSAPLALALALTFGGSVYGATRKKRQRRDEDKLARAVSQAVHVPPSLHPVIDPDICIGSMSCIKACPEGDILGLANGRAALIEGAACIGHGRCAVECPVDAIKLVFGSSERGVDLPEVDETFESSRPGVHIVGELGGMGLIHNAMKQGVEVAAHLVRRLGRRDLVRSDTAQPRFDVVIVGAGPAGLAAALSARAEGLTALVLEQGSIGGAVAHYPRHKIVMSQSIQLPLYGRFGKARMTKEELLQRFLALVEAGDLQIVTGARVTAIDGGDGAFVVRAEDGSAHLARKVVLAAGRRGTPKKLDVPGEALAKVTYGLVDAEQYAGARVLVVGGGDSALEAAAMLAERGDVEVTIAYRGPTFVRARGANREKASALVGEGRMRALFRTEVRAITAREVILGTPEGERRLPNDYVIACIGGQLPLEMLGALQIGVKRHFGTPARASSHAGMSRASPEVLARRHRIFSIALFVIGALIVGALGWLGKDYYLLSPSDRLRSPLHADLRSSGPMGYAIGLMATVTMLSTFLYSLRKRWRRMKGSAPIRTWLTFHVFAGVLTPFLIAFHAVFRAQNDVAYATVLAMGAVLATGLVGRYIYALVPATRGARQETAKAVLSWWRVVHVVLAMFLVVAVAAHVGLAVYLGYGFGAR